MSIKFIVRSYTTGLVTELDGFKDASLDLSMEQLAHTFSLNMALESSLTTPIRKNDFVTVLVDDEPQLRGTVERVSIDYGNDNHSISISGRSITGDLVDSSFPNDVVLNNEISLKEIIEKVLDRIWFSNFPKTVTLASVNEAVNLNLPNSTEDVTLPKIFKTNTTVDQGPSVIEQLLKMNPGVTMDVIVPPPLHSIPGANSDRDPFSAPRDAIGAGSSRRSVPDEREITRIRVVDLVNPPTFKLDISKQIIFYAGKNCFESLDELARLRKVILTTNSNGDIVISRATGSKVKAWVRTGDNIKSGSYSADSTDVFYSVVIIPTWDVLVREEDSYELMPGSESVPFAALRAITRVDKSARKGRCVTLLEDVRSYEDAKNRAEWEVDKRKARAETLTVVVQGFKNQANRLWETNTVISVVDQFAGIDQDMMIMSLSFQESPDGGTTTTLKLTNKDAFRLQISDPGETEFTSGLFSTGRDLRD